MVGQLRKEGFVVDVARDLEEARKAFFASGGHHCLLVAPDVAPGMARQVLNSLRTVDPDLPAATFGTLALDPDARTARLYAYHPSSRAGVGAFLRFLRGLPERA